MPRDVARERGAVLHKALRDLPVALLEPLLRGLRRHADSLVPGSLSAADGGCAVGMMLRELHRSPDRHFTGRVRLRAPTIHEAAPALAREYPRLAHVEFIFDKTCDALRERQRVSDREAARTVGLWMAAEVQAEINLRHLEATRPEALTPTTHLDQALFADTVRRLRELRPWLSEDQAARAVQAWVAGGPPEPVFVPPEWIDEVERQRDRLENSPG